MEGAQFELERLDQLKFLDFEVAFLVGGDQVVLEFDLGDKPTWLNQLASQSRAGFVEFLGCCFEAIRCSQIPSNCKRKVDTGFDIVCGC